MPAQFRECHIATVGGYILEGHVPVESIQRLLKEKPAVLGLVVPGMPAGSPGMESPKGRPYDVLTFDRQGRAAVFERMQPRFY